MKKELARRFSENGVKREKCEQESVVVVDVDLHGGIYILVSSAKKA